MNKNLKTTPKFKFTKKKIFLSWFRIDFAHFVTQGWKLKYPFLGKYRGTKSVPIPTSLNVWNIRFCVGKKKSGPRSNSTLSSREVEFQNWKRRKSYDPMKAAAEGKKKAEMARKQNQNVMTQSYNENQDCDSSPSHSSSVHRSQSFHGTAALEQLISSEEEEDLTLSGEDEEGFSPPTPSPCEMSPSRSNLRQVWMDRFSSSSKR